MPKLMFINKNFEEQAYELMVEKTTVGRGQHNTLVICDTSVSMTHCEILANGPEVIVRDLDSSNGTFVDGMRLNKQSQVKNGQVIRFGLVDARLELEQYGDDDTDAASITAVHDLGKYQREQRRELKKMKVNASGMVEPSAGVEAEGHTVLLPRPPAPQFRPPTETDEETEVSLKAARVKALIVIGIAVVVVVLIVWWLWTR